jgi:hypothetical protein
VTAALRRVHVEVVLIRHRTQVMRVRARHAAELPLDDHRHLQYLWKCRRDLVVRVRSGGTSGNRGGKLGHTTLPPKHSGLRKSKPLTARHFSSYASTSCEPWRGVANGEKRLGSGASSLFRIRSPSFSELLRAAASSCCELRRLPPIPVPDECEQSAPAVETWPSVRNLERVTRAQLPLRLHGWCQLGDGTSRVVLAGLLWAAFAPPSGQVFTQGITDLWQACCRRRPG